MTVGVQTGGFLLVFVGGVDHRSVKLSSSCDCSLAFDLLSSIGDRCTTYEVFVHVVNLQAPPGSQHPSASAMTMQNCERRRFANPGVSMF